MDEHIFELIFSNLSKGKELEKEKKYEEALKLYFENLQYNPEGIDYYERPCIVLEKLGRYEEAIDICKNALVMIELGKFNGDVTALNKRITRLEKKNNCLNHLLR